MANVKLKLEFKTEDRDNFHFSYEADTTQPPATLMDFEYFLAFCLQDIQTKIRQIESGEIKDVKSISTEHDKEYVQ